MSKRNERLKNQLGVNFPAYCEKCKTITRHDRVKYTYRWYNRCGVCLEKEIKKYGIYIPPFVRQGHLGKFRADFKMLKVL